MRNGGRPVLMDYLGHIVQAVERIERYTGTIDCAAFLANGETSLNFVVFVPSW